MNFDRIKMAAPLEQFLAKRFLRISHEVGVNSPKPFHFRKHGFIWKPLYSKNCELMARNCKRHVCYPPPLFPPESGQSCSRNFRGSVRRVTAAFCTASHFQNLHQARGRRSFDNSQGKSNGNFSLALGIGGFALCSASLLFSFWKEDKKETIEMMIARAVIAERENRLGDADKFYHQATVACEKEKNSQALLYTYDQMANFNMRHGRLMKAENLFKETLQLLLSSGIQQEDPGVVEISLKLSRIYERMGRNDEADVGFKWCIDTSEKLLKDTPDDSTVESHDKIMNLKSLLGMCLDAYARFLGATNRLADAERLYKRALEICESDLQVDGSPHPRTVVLLNDLGTICDMRGNRDNAIEHVQRAVELAEKSSPAVLPTILCNLASIKMHKGLKDEARTIYKRALKLAEKEGDREAVLIIRANLQKVL
nr:tetratricopeptide repeat protein 19, mitochondrial-like isoform X2 [Lytechinus pictus]